MNIYRCPNCGWEGSTSSMQPEGCELICPECQEVVPMVVDMFSTGWQVVEIIDDRENEDYGEF